MKASSRTQALSADDARVQVLRRSEAANEASSVVAEDPSVLSQSFAISRGQDADSARVEVVNRSPAVDEPSPVAAEEPSASSFALGGASRQEASSPWVRAQDGGVVAVREVRNSSEVTGLRPRYMHDQNLGQVPFYGSMTARNDYTHRFIWLVWSTANVDIDLSIDLFDRDPQSNASAVPIDSQRRRVQLSANAVFGYEYSRLVNGTDYYVRISFVDYTPGGDVGNPLWTQGYS